MKVEQFDKLLCEFQAKMKAVLINKGHDYSDTDDRLANFRLSEMMGLPAWKGILIRMSDKMARLLQFSKKGLLEVKDESLEDTLLDLANYAVLCLAAYQDNRQRMGAVAMQHYTLKPRPLLQEQLAACEQQIAQKEKEMERKRYASAITERPDYRGKMFTQMIEDEFTKERS